MIRQLVITMIALGGIAACGAPVQRPAPVQTVAAAPEKPEEIYEGHLIGVLWDYQAQARPDPRYPVILSDVAAQRALGLLETNYGPYDGSGPLANMCFYYGDGGNALSVSDAFLAPYLARGFSRETVCMGLVSGIRFDPETGQRLATVVIANVDEVSSPDFSGEPGAITDELPVALPDCFRRGLALSDCRFLYHPELGVRLKPEHTAVFARAGERILTQGRRLLAAGKYARPCAAGLEYRDIEDESCYTGANEPRGEALQREYRVNANHPAMVPLGGFFRFSPDFDEGFAYAILADGAAGPSASMESVTLVVDGKNRASQARLQALKIAAGK